MTTEEKLFAFIADKLDTLPDYPFSGDRETAVFRHRGNRKWFAILLRGVPRAKLGGGEGRTDVVNLKCDPLFSGSARSLPGVYPAYHMNKEHWISVALDVAEEEALFALVCMSYDLTFPKAGRADKAERPDSPPPDRPGRNTAGGRRGCADSEGARSGKR